MPDSNKSGGVNTKDFSGQEQVSPFHDSLICLADQPEGLQLPLKNSSESSTSQEHELWTGLKDCSICKHETRRKDIADQATAPRKSGETSSFREAPKPQTTIIDDRYFFSSSPNGPRDQPHDQQCAEELSHSAQRKTATSALLSSVHCRIIELGERLRRIESREDGQLLMAYQRALSHITRSSCADIVDLLLTFEGREIILERHVKQLQQELEESRRNNTDLRGRNLNLEIRLQHELGKTRSLHEGFDAEIEITTRQQVEPAELQPCVEVIIEGSGLTRDITNDLQAIRETISEPTGSKIAEKVEEIRAENAELRSQLITMKMELEEALEERREAREHAEEVCKHDKKKGFRIGIWQSTLARYQNAVGDENTTLVEMEETKGRERKALEKLQQTE